MPSCWNPFDQIPGATFENLFCCLLDSALGDAAASLSIKSFASIDISLDGARGKLVGAGVHQR